jgi:hypothetical protein
MNINLRLALFLLAASSPALAADDPTPGRVGTVTIALITSYETEGFNGTDEKIITSTATLYKDQYKRVVKKEKLSNKELITTFLAHYSLSGPASDWRIDYVDEYGFFLVKNTGTIKFLGNQDTPDLPLNIYGAGGLISNTFGTYTATGSSNNLSTEVSDIKSNSQQTIYIELLTPRADPAYITGIYSSSVSYKETINYIKDTYLETYTVPAASITNITGDNYDLENPQIITGSIRISAQKNLPDINNYIKAYNATQT